MATATITSKGQITLPKEVREHLGLRRGDRVDFVIDTEGNVHMRAAKRSVSELFGFLRRPDAVSVSIEEIDESIAQSRQADEERIRSSWNAQPHDRSRDRKS